MSELDEPAKVEAEAESAPESPQAPAAELAMHWAQAEAHALAAAALLDDPSVPPWTAAQHLRQGLKALARAAGLPAPTSLATMDLSALPWVGAPQSTADAVAKLETEDDTSVEPDALRRLSATLSAAVRNAQDERFAPQRRAARRRQWLRRLLMTLLVLTPVIVAIVLTAPDYREGPWRGEFYSNPGLEGEPTMVRRDGDVKFNWQRRSPTADMPQDGFSARWDSCMVLDEDLSVAFQLVSDDGSRLYVDGELVVDNWGRHGERSRGADDVPLSAGVHHLRVEYYDDRHAATVKLKASLRGELPDSIPVRVLRYPGEQPDPDDPCAAVRDAGSGG